MPAAELTAALTGGIGRQLRRFADVIVFDRTPRIWRGAPHPLAVLAGIENPNASFQLPLLGTMERTLAQVNAKRRRKKMRISERRLAEIGGYDYVIAREAQEAHALLETFFRQKAARFETLGLPDAFREAETRTFFHALIDARGPEPGNLLELNAIRLRGEHAGRVVAVAGLSRKGDHVICQFGSIDEEIAADASPGELLFYRMIERLCAEGVALFDFGIGDQPYKRSWCTVETPLRDIVLPLTFRGRLAAGGFRAIARANGWSRPTKRFMPSFNGSGSGDRHRLPTRMKRDVMQRAVGKIWAVLPLPGHQHDVAISGFPETHQLSTISSSLIDGADRMISVPSCRATLATASASADPHSIRTRS